MENRGAGEMVKVTLNDAEQEILDRNDYKYEALYRRAIRRYMDYRTGLVGISRGISWQSLKEEMYIPPRSGVEKNKTLGEYQLKRMVKHLEREGLVQLKSTPARLILFCPLADRDNNVQNKAAPRPHPQANAQAAPSKTAKTQSQFRFAVIGEPEAAPEAAPGVMAQAAPPPYTDNITKINTNKNICRFEDFWGVYPRREKKKQARDIWVRKKLDEIADGIISDVLKRKQAHSTWIAGYIPHATTYLNGERWNDEIREINNEANSTGINASNSRKGQSILQVLATCRQSAENERCGTLYEGDYTRAAGMGDNAI